MRQDLAVVEGKRWRFTQAEPADLGGIIGGDWLELGETDDGEICDRNGATARVSAGVAKRVELLEFFHFQSRFFPQFPVCRCFKRLVHVHEPAGQCPCACEGFVLAADEQDPRIAATGDENDVHCHGGARVVVGEIVRHIQVHARVRLSRFPLSDLPYPFPDR